MQPMLEAACTLLQRGVNVLPVSRETKRPYLTSWKSWQENRQSLEQIRSWWQRYPQANVAIVTGAISGLCVVDADTTEAVTWCEENLPPTPLRVQTGKGMHFYYRHPGGAIKNAVRVAPGVDIRGDGGYAVAPPSVHNTGIVYSWLLPKGVTVDDAFAALPPFPTREIEHLKPIPAIPAFASEASQLAPVPVGERNNALAKLVGSLLAKGRREEEVMLTARGWNNSLPEPLPEREVERTVKSIISVNSRNHPEQTLVTGWPPLVPFEKQAVPKLDVNKLPPVLGDFCAGVAEEKQVPVELTVAMSLATLATAAQGQFRVQIREGYTEPLNIYTLCPLEPANRKSSTVEACIAPLLEWERRQEEILGPALKHEQSRRKTLEKAIEAKRSKAAAAASLDQMMRLQEEVEALERELPEIPRVPKLLADNITPEALAVLLAEMGGRIAIITAEGGIFDILAGLYSQGKTNLDLFLKAHSGDTFRVDRRSSSPLLLDSPCLTLGISPQPVTLAERTASRLFRGRGLDGRFLYFLPESLLGRRKLEPRHMDEHAKRAFHDAVCSILPEQWSQDMPAPVVLELSKEAYRCWLLFAGEVEKELSPGGEFEGLSDWGGKLAGAVARLSGLFHLVTHQRPEQMKITSGTMQQAVYLGSFLTEHAKAAYALMGADVSVEGARKILNWIRREAADKFTTQACWQGVRRGCFQKMEEVQAALKELEGRGFIKAIQIERQGPGRKPAPMYLVNPAALKG